MRRPRAAILLRHTSHYRADVFAKGLEKLGFHTESKWERVPHPSDLLVIWNRGRSFESIARIYEQHGARVLVAENGYLDRDRDGSKLYALALSAHNGRGHWFVGDKPRFEVEEQEWRTSGGRILVLPQRGIGQSGVAMPTGWPKWIMRRLAEITDREIVFRQHPGHQRVEQPLDFTDLHCAITWGSGAGIKALRAGIPVFHDMPGWIGSAASFRLAEEIEHCHTPDRTELWRRVSWAQWRLDEIETGEAMDRLLNEEDRRLFRFGEQPLGDHCSSDGAGGLEVRSPCSA